MAYLKIKDDVDLKELEKFGFENNVDWGYDCYIDNSCYPNIWIDFKDRIINGNGCGYEETFSVIYDLIEAGLVEKVVE